MAERKMFTVVKVVPFVNHVYGAVKDDKTEAKHSVTMDLVDLNPLRIPKNLAHSIVNATNNLDKDIWIGRRPLFNQTIALNISPGVDGYHWYIQINGIIYELGVDKDNGGINISICSENKDLPEYDPQVLRSFAKSSEEREYRMYSAAAHISMKKITK